MIKQVKAYCRELPLRKFLSEINQFETRSDTDTKNSRVNRKLRKYQAGQPMKYVKQWNYFRHSFGGGSPFFVEDSSWFLILHE